VLTNDSESKALPSPSLSYRSLRRRQLHRRHDREHRRRRCTGHNADGSYTFHAGAGLQRRRSGRHYTATDGALTSTATLTISVTPSTTPPGGVNDSITTLEDTPVSGNVLTNDTDVDGPSKTVTQFVVAHDFAAGATATWPASARLVINGDGSYTFTPACRLQRRCACRDLHADGWFTHLDRHADPEHHAGHDAPVGVNDSVTTLEDTPVSGNVLTNDTDVDGPSRTVTQFVVGGTTYIAGSTAGLAGVGTLVINAGWFVHLHAGGELRRRCAGCNIHAD